MTEVVSNFELLFLDQSPEPPEDVEEVARVIQGYFLSISNLEDEDYTFSLDFRILDPGPDLPLRSLADNTFVSIDLPNDNNRFTRLISFDGELFTISGGGIRIPAHGTAKVAVLPQLFGPVGGDTTTISEPDFEVRGYVSIRVPRVPQERPLPEDSPFAGTIGRVPLPQGTEPVRVLLTPQYRASYLKGKAIVDQTQSTVPTCNGAGITAVTPDQGRFSIATPLATQSLAVDSVLDSLDPGARGALLANLLATAEAESEEDVTRMNALLKEAGATLELARRG